MSWYLHVSMGERILCGCVYLYVRTLSMSSVVVCLRITLIVTDVLFTM